MKNILLVEDEAGVVNFIRKGLSEEGYNVSVAPDGTTGYQLSILNQFDLIILDIMLPDINGLEVCKNIRSAGIETPILFLTALSTAENIALGLNSGADDYLVKPFKFIELDARIKALLRRTDSYKPNQKSSTQNLYSISTLQVNDDAKLVTLAGETINLTATEYRLLLELIKNKGRVLSRVDLLEKVWDINFNVGTNVVDVYINYLRKKIEKDHKLIHTIIGMGYVLKKA